MLIGTLSGTGMGILSAEIDTYLEGSIAQLVGLSCSEEQLRQKLEQVEKVQRYLQSQVLHLQRRLQDTEDKCNKAKEEACLSAQALKRQIAESQKLTEYSKLITEECQRLENECTLYHKDREIFLEAADDAEERAAEAENRAADAESRFDKLFSKMERIQNIDALDCQMENLRLAEEVTILSLTRQKLEADDKRLHCALDAVNVKNGSKFDWRSARQYAIKMEHQEAELRAELAAAKERHRLSILELQKVRKMNEEEKAHVKDEFVVHSMVSSAVSSAVCKAAEQEKEEELNAVKLQYESIFKVMEAQWYKTQDRLKNAENNVKVLVAEIKGLKKNAQTYERNLKKAEIEVQVLFEENQTWNRFLFRDRHEDQSPSPLHIQGIKCHSDKHYRRCSLGQENVSPTWPRQPLTPIKSNLSERKVFHH